MIPVNFPAELIERKQKLFDHFVLNSSNSTKPTDKFRCGSRRSIRFLKKNTNFMEEKFLEIYKLTSWKTIVFLKFFEISLMF